MLKSLFFTKSKLFKLCHFWRFFIFLWTFKVFFGYDSSTVHNLWYKYRLPDIWQSLAFQRLFRINGVTSYTWLTIYSYTSKGKKMKTVSLYYRYIKMWIKKLDSEKLNFANKIQLFEPSSFNGAFSWLWQY